MWSRILLSMRETSEGKHKYNFYWPNLQKGKLTKKKGTLWLKFRKLDEEKVDRISFTNDKKRIHEPGSSNIEYGVREVFGDYPIRNGKASDIH